MKHILALVAALALVAFAAGAMAAEGFTVSAVANTEAEYGSGWPNAFKVIKAAWTAAADGSKADGTIPATKGRLVLVETNPGATAPADDYDLTILDSNGVDITGGALANRDTANSEAVQPLVGSLAYPMGRPFYGPLTVTFTNQANANCDGVIFLYIEE